MIPNSFRCPFCNSILYKGSQETYCDIIKCNYMFRQMTNVIVISNLYKKSITLEIHPESIKIFLHKNELTSLPNNLKENSNLSELYFSLEQKYHRYIILQ